MEPLHQGGSLPSTFAVISGTPAATGLFNFTVKVTDTLSFTGSQAFSIAIAAPSVGGSFTFIA
ncbi:putative Ig domain-containing protein [Terriglobus albidus]|uniref:putative Ig domain-containing protein n=1 Tax=Terriglobus albidus TaxID=1592106 RepID=UPI001C9C7BB7